VEIPVNDFTWLENLPGAVTVCDASGVIVYMNKQAAETFAAEGGSGLIGSSVLDCHPEPARSKLAGLLQTQQQNVYTIEKNGVKKLIYQTPWFDADGAFGGLVELSLPVPFEMPHFLRG
jgi:PAS domain-containing protein